jgi:hypothetical protein
MKRYIAFPYYCQLPRDDFDNRIQGCVSDPRLLQDKSFCLIESTGPREPKYADSDRILISARLSSIIKVGLFYIFSLQACE